MRWERAAPFVSLLLNVVSVFSHAWVGDWHKTVYWIGAATINSPCLLGCSVQARTASRLANAQPLSTEATAAISVAGANQLLTAAESSTEETFSMEASLALALPCQNRFVHGKNVQSRGYQPRAAAS
jgi:hypothetical protein